MTVAELERRAVDYSEKHVMTRGGVICSGRTCEHVVVRASLKKEAKSAPLLQFIRCKWCKHMNVIDYENLSFVLD